MYSIIELDAQMSEARRMVYVQVMVVPEEREGKMENDPYLSRDPTPASAVTNTRKGGLQKSVQQRVNVSSERVKFVLSEFSTPVPIECCLCIVFCTVQGIRHMTTFADDVLVYFKQLRLICGFFPRKCKFNRP